MIRKSGILTFLMSYTTCSYRQVLAGAGGLTFCEYPGRSSLDTVDEIKHHHDRQ